MRRKGRHRIPPRPRFMLKPKRGHCKFCGDRIIDRQGKINKGAFWHSECSLKWSIMNNPQVARRFVFVRDRGICADCGMDCSPGGQSSDQVRRIIEEILNPVDYGKPGLKPLALGRWELDHIIPLSEAPKQGNPHELWTLKNMATRCPPCHTVKTANDRELYAET